MQSIGYNELTRLFTQASKFSFYLPDNGGPHDASGWMLKLTCERTLRGGDHVVGVFHEYHVISFQRGGFALSPTHVGHFGERELMTMRILLQYEIKKCRRTGDEPRCAVRLDDGSGFPIFCIGQERYGYAQITCPDHFAKPVAGSDGVWPIQTNGHRNDELFRSYVFKGGKKEKVPVGLRKGRNLIP